MWRTLIRKIDNVRDLRRFWTEISKITGRRRKVKVETFKNENGKELKTREEVLVMN